MNTTLTLSDDIPSILDMPEMVVITERVDDIVLLLTQMIRMGMPTVLDNYIPKQDHQRELSWGWTATIWLAYILTEGDHRKVSVDKYITGMHNTLIRITKQTIDVLDFDDDRLSHLLRYLSNPKIWNAIEQDLNRRSIAVYELPTQVIRCDPTTVSGYHCVKEDGLMQFGNSKDDPTLPQIKLVVASLDPLGMPLAIEVVSGEHADDTLYVELIDRVNATLNTAGLLFVGDCKLSSLTNRSHIAIAKHFYLSPLPLTGCTAKSMPEWITNGINKIQDGSLESVFRENELGEISLITEGYEFERTQHEQTDKEILTWQERVFVVHSPAYVEQQSKGLEKRLTTAQQQIRLLTPNVGKGKRQITEEETIKTAIARIVKKEQVEQLLKIEYEKQSKFKKQYVGRGRGSNTREQQIIEKIRLQINLVERIEPAIIAAKQHFGWKVFVTNAAKSMLSLTKAMLCYRKEYRIERIFNRLKSRLNIAPLFVKRDDQIQGLTYLLTLAVRVLTLTEYVVRSSLQKDKIKLPGLHPENHRKETDKPTAERILKAFDRITLTIIQNKFGNEILRWLSPLTPVQQTILKSLGLNDTYEMLRNSS